MNTIRKKRTAGLTLIEVMVGMVIIIVGVLGAFAYRYYAALDARKAYAEITASRLALLLLETWEGIDGCSDYDPVAEFASQLVISSDSGPDVPDGFTKLGSYQTVVNRANYYVTLSYRDETASEPNTLNVSVAWLQNYQAGTVSSDDKTVKLTTYVNN